MTDNARRPAAIWNPDFAAAVLLATVGLVCFVARGTSFWGWPSLDMAPLYVNLEHANFIAHDFFTSCFGTNNGRALFGKLTAWPIQLGLHWYTTLYLWMLLNSALMPAAVYLCLATITPSADAKSKLIVAAAVLLQIAMPNLANFLTVGWWRGWGIEFHPSMFCISALFLGCYFLAGESRRPMRQIVGAALTFLSAVLHPAFVLGGAMFLALILLFRANGFRTAVILLLCVLAGQVVVKLYSGSGALGPADYFRYFSQLHPEHYLPTRFVAMGPFPWWLPVCFISLALPAIAAFLYGIGRRRQALLPLAFLVFYVASLAGQYLLVEKFPISSIVILISPSRFLAFGYWMLAVSVAMVASSLGNRGGRLRAPFFSNPSPRLLGKTGVAMSYLGIAVLIAGVVSYEGVTRLKGPLESTTPEEQRVLAWISSHTQSSDEIAAPAFLPVAIPLITGRGTYSGNGFPFDDGCIRENYARYLNLSGDPTTPHGRRDADRFFDSLDLQHFKEMQPRPDWVVMNRDSAGAKRSLEAAIPQFESDRYLVFSVK